MFPVHSEFIDDQQGCFCDPVQEIILALFFGGPDGGSHPCQELVPPDESGVFPLQFCFSADGTGQGRLSGSWRSVDGEVFAPFGELVECMIHGDSASLPLEGLEGIEGGIAESVEVGIGELVLPLVEECLLRGLDVDVLVAVFELPGQFVSFLVGLLVLGLNESGDGFPLIPPFAEGCFAFLGAVREDPFGEDLDHVG